MLFSISVSVIGTHVDYSSLRSICFRSWIVYGPALGFKVSCQQELRTVNLISDIFTNRCHQWFDLKYLGVLWIRMTSFLAIGYCKAISSNCIRTWFVWGVVDERFNNLHPPRAVFPKASKVTHASIRRTLDINWGTWRLSIMSIIASLRMPCYELHVAILFSFCSLSHCFHSYYRLRPISFCSLSDCFHSYYRLRPFFFFAVSPIARSLASDADYKLEGLAQICLAYVRVFELFRFCARAFVVVVACPKTIW